MGKEITPIERITRLIFVLRKQQVMLDSDLATLYDVPSGHVNRAVKRNPNRFPADFMFQLTAEEVKNLKCQIGISSRGGRPQKSQREIGFHVRENAARYRVRRRA